MTLDDVRAAFPAFALALYALEPGGPVTLEAITPDGESWKWEGPTEAAVLAAAFPTVTPAAPAIEPDAASVPPEQDIFA